MLGIGYIQKFYTRERSDPYNLSDMLRLSWNLAVQPLKEIAGYHKRLINKPYLDENELADWLPYLHNTLQWILFRHYFRPEASGIENIPDTGAMFVANHSGMWGWDGIALQYAVFHATGRTVAGMSHRIFDGSDLTKTMGMVTGTRGNALKHLTRDRLILVCPGGGREVAKPYSERYRVQRVGGFARDRCGYLMTALEAKKPIIPVGIVGAEETHIILGNIKPQLDELVNIVYQKLPKRIRRKLEPYKERWDVSKTFPLMLNLIPFPSKISIRIGKPITPHKYTNDFPIDLFRQLRERKKKGEFLGWEPRGFCDLEYMLHNLNEQVLEEIQSLVGDDFRYVQSKDGEQSLLLKI